MPTVRILTTLCLACAAAFAFAQAAPPTAYTITESVAGGVPGTTIAPTAIFISSPQTPVTFLSCQ